MSTVNELISLGTPAEMAKRIGWTPIALTTTAATQGSSGGLIVGIGKKIVTLTVASAGHAVTLPSAAEIGDEIIISNTSANAAVLFPHSGGNVNGEATDASMAIAASGSTNCVVKATRVSSARWAVWSAVVS